MMVTKPLLVAGVTSLMLAASMAASGQTPGEPDPSRPNTENGRYTLAPSADGFIRMDTRNGAVSSCADKGSGWACYTLPDERTALDAEIGRLQSENETLRAKLAEQSPTVSGKTNEPLPKQDSLKPADPKVADGERKIEIPLPSDRDMDRVMGFIENAWKRLVDIANRMQHDAGKI